MSPNVGNFVHDLVEMAKAVEVLPKVEAELEEAKHQLDDARQDVQSRELRIMDLNKKLEELTAKLQSAEASRDDAEYRFLEIDEKFTKIRSLVGEIQGNANQIATQAAEQPKEEPKAEETQHQDQNTSTSTDPDYVSKWATPSWATPTPQNEHPTEASLNAPEHKASEVAPPDPTANSTAGDGHSPSTADTPTNVQPIDAASTHNDSNSFRPDNDHSATNKPYLNRRYEDYPRYVEFRDWIAGGGTEYDYHYRSGSARHSAS